MIGAIFLQMLIQPLSQFFCDKPLLTGVVPAIWETIQSINKDSCLIIFNLYQAWNPNQG